MFSLLLLLACTTSPDADATDSEASDPEESDAGETDTPRDTSTPPAPPEDTGTLQDPPRAGALARSSALGPIRYLPAGTFTMGCVEGRDDVGAGCMEDERPAREVTLTTPLWMTQHETMQATWEALGFANHAYFLDPYKPIDVLTWWETLAFANAASAADGLTACYALDGCDDTPLGEGRQCASATIIAPSGAPKDCTGWRLPTEAEWEYAARAGTDDAFPGGADAALVGWHFGNNRGHTIRRSCRLAPNAWGLCDMSGNVYEWVWDPYAPNDPSAAPLTDPVSPRFTIDPIRVMRGGSWNMEPQYLRSSSRNRNQESYRGIGYIGFRLVRSVP